MTYSSWYVVCVYHPLESQPGRGKPSQWLRPTIVGMQGEWSMVYDYGVRYHDRAQPPPLLPFPFAVPVVLKLKVRASSLLDEIRAEATRKSHLEELLVTNQVLVRQNSPKFTKGARSTYVVADRWTSKIKSRCGMERARLD